MRSIPNSFYNGTTGIIPIDDTINKINKYDPLLNRMEPIKIPKENIMNDENNYINIIADLKGSLVFKENNFVGVCTFTYEKEAASTEM